MRSSLKRKLAIGATATAAAAFAGGAYAATQTTSNSRQAFLNDVANRLNVSPQQLKDALNGAFDDQLAAAVAAGKLTQAQANAIKKAIQQRGGAPFAFGPLRHFGGPPPLGAPGLAPGLKALPALPGHPFLRARGGRFEAAAKYLGLSEAQLFNQLASGKSLAQIAKARGKSVSGLKNAMSTAIKARLDKAVSAKLLTSAQEQEILGRLGQALDNQINRRGLAPRFAPLKPRKWTGPGGTRVYPGWGPRTAPGGSGVPVPPAPPGQVF
jgi:hypothetical protein